MEIDARQRAAIEDCCDTNKRLVAVTGQAGTGKTTIIKQVYDQLQTDGWRVAVAAPTGKAARRIKEITGIPAITVHKLLEYPRPGEYDPDTGKPLVYTIPKRNRENPLKAHFVIVDEYAMVSTELHRNLVDALPPGGRIRVFGDIAQLPPIDDGYITTHDYKTPFEKCLAMKNSHTLDTVYRQDEGSDVLIAARSIRLGRAPMRAKNFNLKFTDKPVDAVGEYIRAAAELGVDFSTYENQVITPSKKTWTGTHALNTMLQGLFKPHAKDGVLLPRHKWDKTTVRVGVGDKVVCSENTYDLRSYTNRYAYFHEGDAFKPDVSTFIQPPDSKMMLNGEIGVVVGVQEDGSLEIDFGDRVVEVGTEIEEFWTSKKILIRVDYRRNLDLAYALTTHKCQGSEFNHVVYVLNKSSWYNLNRKNFYTAITRARKSAMVITDQRGFFRSIGNAG